MTARPLMLLLAVPTAGVLVGSGVAALAHAPGNDPCLDFGGRVEGGSSWDGSLELWPLGLRCESFVEGRPADTEFFGPTPAELYACIAAAVLLAAIVLLRRDSALLRGAASAALLLALVGAGWQYLGAQLVLSASVVLAAPVAFVTDHRLRPAGARSPRASLYVAIALGAATFCAIFGVLFIPAVGIAFGLLAGALASAALERSGRRTPAVTT